MEREHLERDEQRAAYVTATRLKRYSGRQMTLKGGSR